MDDVLNKLNVVFQTHVHHNLDWICFLHDAFYFRKLPTVFVNSFDVFGICAISAFEENMEMEMSFVGVFCWAWPRSSCCFVDLETKRKSGWGICGSSWFVILRFCVLICLFTGTGQLCWVSPFSPLISLSGPCHRAFTAKLEEKKMSLFLERW